jgi:hypothetical protein
MAKRSVWHACQVQNTLVLYSPETLKHTLATKYCYKVLLLLLYFNLTDRHLRITLLLLSGLSRTNSRIQLKILNDRFLLEKELLRLKKA